MEKLMDSKEALKPSMAMSNTDTMKKEKSSENGSMSKVLSLTPQLTLLASITLTEFMMIKLVLNFWILSSMKLDKTFLL
jgi:hypothetical protein